ncbi:MAG: anion transporter [Pirellulaceae bacterium]|nr:anion transporter [Pirellulaceae bacterium]
METLVLIVFFVVYLGMILGEIPGLALDRTGIALLGAIVLIATGCVEPQEAWQAVDVPTIGLLFGLMVVSAQFRLGGFYSRFTHWLSGLSVSPSMLLALVIGAAGLLSAVLCNDIVCLAMAPVLVDGCARRRLNPLPFLLALACAANVGSAATLIGNPQNMLIGQMLQLSFASYLLEALPPAALGLVAVWWVIRRQAGGNWRRETVVPSFDEPRFDRWQTAKGFVVLVVLMTVFVMDSLPREIAALGAAGILLTSRRMASRAMLQLVDWQLLVLFGGLFIVNHAMAEAGNTERLFAAVRSGGIDPSQPTMLFVTSVVLSNLVSNVPATMLLLPSAHHPLAGAVLALSSTLAGNLLVVGSIANIIVIDQAAQLGQRITWRDHAKVGIPVTLITLAIAAAWLILLTWMQGLAAAHDGWNMVG